MGVVVEAIIDSDIACSRRAIAIAAAVDADGSTCINLCLSAYRSHRGAVARDVDGNVAVDNASGITAAVDAGTRGAVTQGTAADVDVRIGRDVGSIAAAHYLVGDFAATDVDVGILTRSVGIGRHVAATVDVFHQSVADVHSDRVLWCAILVVAAKHVVHLSLTAVHCNSDGSKVDLTDAVLQYAVDFSSKYNDSEIDEPIVTTRWI